MPAAHLEPMTFEEYDSIVTHLVADHARQQAESGLLPEPEATSYARAQHERVLPAGIATPNHHLWTVRDAGGAQVGVLWLHVRPRDGGGRVEAFVYDVEVAPHARGRGLGRATMLAAEDAARGLGAELMRLNVFGHNRAAIGLYTALGYEAAMLAMSRRVAEPAAEGGADRQLVSADMTSEDFAGFRARLEDDLAAGLARSQLMPEQVAREEARAAVTRLRPDGRATAGALLFTVGDGDTVVADLW